MAELSEYKKKVFEKCQETISSQIESIRSELKKLQEMEGEETKSSAGDKYETGRAMLFLEKEKISFRLDEILKKQKTLGQIKIEKKNDIVGLGSLVKTDKGFFFISVSLGKIDLDDTSCFLISPVSPIGQALCGKTKGDQASFNSTTYEILEVA